MIRVLSIDGGGIRGVLPATILVALEQRIQKLTNNPEARLIDYLDFVAGTSTGGIISVLLNTPKSEAEPNTPKYSAQQVLDFYDKRGSDIFKSRWLSRMFASVGLADDKYDVASLEKVLQDNLGEDWLSRQMKPSLIPAFHLESGRPYFFCAHDHQKGKANTKDFLTRDVCRSTSAAPSYFEPANVKNATEQYFPFIDGGVFANNPTLCAIAEVGKAVGAYSPKDMVVLSLGTGRVQTSYSFKKWRKTVALMIVPDLLNIMMDGVSETTHYITKRLFDNLNVGDQYLRIDPILDDPKVAAMDNATPENIGRLKRIGEQVVRDYDVELTRMAQALIGTPQSTRRGLMSAPTTEIPASKHGDKLVFE